MWSTQLRLQSRERRTREACFAVGTVGVSGCRYRWSMPLTGEQIQLLGEQGSHRAKRWLESTCRAEVKWNNPSIGVSRLQYRKAGADPDSEAQGDFFSFDLGGTLLGGESEGELFFAESKKYESASDQGTHYRKFIAQCYRVETEYGQFCDHYLWITWAPFLVNSWDELRTPQYVEKAVTGDESCRYIALGDSPYQTTAGENVAIKLIIVVLADAQEVVLSLHGNELLHVRKALLEYRNDQ